MRSLIIRIGKLFPLSLTAEVLKIFGPEKTEKLFTVFAGTTLHIPSTRVLDEVERDLAIYDTLQNSKSASESRRLAEVMGKQYRLHRKEIRTIYRRMRKQMKDSNKVYKTDMLTSQHQPRSRKTNTKRRSRRRY